MQGNTPLPEMPEAANPTRTNWAGNYTYRARGLAEPASAEAVRAAVTSLHHAKPVGTRHSFNHIADTEDTQIALSSLKSMELSAADGTVTVGAGVTYGELAPWLHARGFAVHNLASLPHISVAGACATATHGSGLKNGCLATAVVALDLVDGNGQQIRLSRADTPELFRFAAVGLGALGVITSLTLAVLPMFEVAQTVYENLSFNNLQGNLREIFSSGYSVSLFTDWQERRITQAWVKRRVETALPFEQSASFFGASAQTRKLHPLPDISAENCTEQQGIVGPWHERLPHFRMDYTPSAGAELQSEYFVPLEHAYEAILAVEQLRDQITPHLLITELRTIAADDLPMSMCFQRDSLAIHFTWKQEMAPVLALLPLVEAQLAPFAARPHWAKLFTMSPARVRSLYPEIQRFAELMREFDPEGKFRNAYLAELLHP